MSKLEMATKDNHSVEMRIRLLKLGLEVILMIFKVILFFKRLF